jgi:asparagine synthase (glutamine-hydrolysing)
MCGLAGMVVRRGGAPPARERIEDAIRALRHRGPDGSGSYVTEAVGLAHTRLSIVDVEGGAQPLRNEDGSVVTVYNGEIWNFPELRRELELAGHRFRTRCDTEVLVHGYEEWGAGLPARLNGMFAFAIWDERRERILLARDRVGEKPLYVARTAEGVAFGSDLRSVLIVAGIRPVLDEDRVAEFLFQRYVTSPATLVRGVEKLPPGHLLEYDRERAVGRAYWSVPDGDDPLDPHSLRELLRDSARRRLMSDVPLGVLLSGGIDSAAVAGLLREAGARDLASFTVGFDDPLYDERDLARVVARRLGTDHHEVVVGRGDFVSALPRLAWFRDEPIAEPSEVPLFLLARFAARHVKVVLSGDGGDEVFGGYPKYRAERLLALPTGLPALACRAGVRVLRTRPTHRRLGRAAETLEIRDPLLRWASWFRTFASQELAGLLRPGLAPSASPEALVGPLERRLEAYRHLDPARRMLIGDLLTYLPDNMLLRSDKVLMSASLEGRMPLLDYRIVERATSTPAAERSSIRTPKQLLRRATGDLVPGEIASAPKRGFTVPVARFLLSDDERPLQSLILSERALDRGIFDVEGLKRVASGRSREPDNELKVFTLGALELWLRTNVDAVATEPPQSAATREGSSALVF